MVMKKRRRSLPSPSRLGFMFSRITPRPFQALLLRASIARDTFQELVEQRRHLFPTNPVRLYVLDRIQHVFCEVGDLGLGSEGDVFKSVPAAFIILSGIRKAMPE